MQTVRRTFPFAFVLTPESTERNSSSFLLIWTHDNKLLSTALLFFTIINFFFLTVQKSRYFTEFACKGLICNGFELVNELVSARITGCKIKMLFFSCKKSHIINNLITSSVRSLLENLKPRPRDKQGLSLRFSINDRTDEVI